MGCDQVQDDECTRRHLRELSGREATASVRTLDGCSGNSISWPREGSNYGYHTTLGLELGNALHVASGQLSATDLRLSRWENVQESHLAALLSRQRIQSIPLRQWILLPQDLVASHLCWRWWVDVDENRVPALFCSQTVDTIWSPSVEGYWESRTRSSRSAAEKLVAALLGWRWREDGRESELAALLSSQIIDAIWVPSVDTRNFFHGAQIAAAELIAALLCWRWRNDSWENESAAFLCREPAQGVLQNKSSADLCVILRFAAFLHLRQRHCLPTRPMQR